MRSSAASTPAASKPLGKARRRLSMLGIALLLGTGLATVSASPAFADIYGGVKLEEACQDQYGPDYHVALIVYGPTYSLSLVTLWRCYRDIYVLYSVDIKRECEREYGSGVRASYHNFYNAYSWFCED